MTMGMAIGGNVERLVLVVRRTTRDLDFIVQQRSQVLRTRASERAERLVDSALKARSQRARQRRPLPLAARQLLVRIMAAASVSSSTRFSRSRTFARISGSSGGRWRRAVGRRGRTPATLAATVRHVGEQRVMLEDRSRRCASRAGVPVTSTVQQDPAAVERIEAGGDAATSSSLVAGRRPRTAMSSPARTSTSI